MVSSQCSALTQFSVNASHGKAKHTRSVTAEQRTVTAIIISCPTTTHFAIVHPSQCCSDRSMNAPARNNTSRCSQSTAPLGQHNYNHRRAKRWKAGLPVGRHPASADCTSQHAPKGGDRVWRDAGLCIAISAAACAQHVTWQPPPPCFQRYRALDGSHCPPDHSSCAEPTTYHQRIGTQGT